MLPTGTVSQGSHSIACLKFLILPHFQPNSASFLISSSKVPDGSLWSCKFISFAKIAFLNIMVLSLRLFKVSLRLNPLLLNPLLLNLWFHIKCLVTLFAEKTPIGQSPLAWPDTICLGIPGLVRNMPTSLFSAMAHSVDSLHLWKLKSPTSFP